MIKENIIFMGSTRFSEKILKSLIKDNCNIKAIFSIPEHFSISYSDVKVKNINYVNLKPYSEQLRIPYFEINSEEGHKLLDFEKEIKEIFPNVIIAAGWFYMIPKKIRQIPRHGVWCLHASLLPNYAGGAPLVWAMINGEKETGVTLFRADGGIDDGDIIFQKKIKIKEKYKIKDLLKKSSKVAKKIVLKAVNQNKIIYNPQDKSKIKIFPQRSPMDGEIDWSWDSKTIINFVKAQSKPYPGAWTIINGKKITLWDISIQN